VKPLQALQFIPSVWTPLECTKLFQKVVFGTNLSFLGLSHKPAFWNKKSRNGLASGSDELPKI
jgi:hypothetical protein